MLLSTELRVNSFFLMHSNKTCVFDKFSRVFDNFIHVLKILRIDHYHKIMTSEHYGKNDFFAHFVHISPFQFKVETTAESAISLNT